MSELERFIFKLNKHQYPVYLPSNISKEEAEEIEADLVERIDKISEEYHHLSKEDLLSICLIEAVLVKKVTEKEHTHYKSGLNKDLHDLLETLNREDI